MEYTEQQKVTFKEQFTRRRRRQIMITVPVVAIFIGLAAFADDEGNIPILTGIPPEVLVPVVVVLVGMALAFSFRNWRCPACDKYLGKGINPHFCPKCGAPLQ